MIQSKLKWSVISAVNNHSVLESCLLRSPDVSQASQALLQKGYTSAALAYNAALQEATTDVLVFLHQDVYLPPGWIQHVRKALEWLSKRDPAWAVLGAWGVKTGGSRAGYLYCAGLQQVLGRPFEGCEQVRTLDEALLILRRSSGLQFDERLRGFHMYGTDICLEAARRHMNCYAISAFCIHNTNGYEMLPVQFWKSYVSMRKKWRLELPIITPCTEITYGCRPVLEWNLRRLATILLRRHHAGKRVQDPSELYREMVRRGSVPSMLPLGEKCSEGVTDPSRSKRSLFK